MSKELLLSKFKELGFTLEDAGEFGYFFKFEELNFLYIPDDDENFLRLAVPNIFDVTADNRPLVMEVVKLVLINGITTRMEAHSQRM